MGRKGGTLRNRRFGKGADVGKWLCGRAESITEWRAAPASGRFHSSSLIKTEGLLMHWWGLNVSGELSHWVLSLIVLRLRAGDSAPESSLSPLNYHGASLPVELILNSCPARLHLLPLMHLPSVSRRSPVTCRLSARPSCGTEDSAAAR